MTIQELILAALQTKFEGVKADILTRIANKKAEGVTDETQVDSIVEGISFQDVLTSYGDFRAGDARLTAIRGYEREHHLKNGKPIEAPKEEIIENPTPHDEVPAWAQTIIDSNKALSEKIAAIESGKAAEARASQVAAKAKEYGIPDALVPMLNIAEDADLDSFMKDAKQTFINAGLPEVIPPKAGAAPKSDEEEVAAMISARTKEIVETKK